MDDTYRLWEALDGGAIPVVQWALYFTTPGGILTDAPFPVMKNWATDLKGLLSAYVNNKKAGAAVLDLQQRCAGGKGRRGWQPTRVTAFL